MTDLLEIGKFYSVPTVRGKIRDIKYNWPVLGPKHNDREIIGFSHEHYHIDWRFVSKRVFQRVGNSGTTPFYGVIMHEGTGLNAKLPAPVISRRRCIRSFDTFRWPTLSWRKKLEAAYAESKMSNMICPHRGVPLKGCEQNGDVVTCPGHGLRWNVNSGALVCG